MVVFRATYVGFANELIKYELMDSLQRYAVFSASDFYNCLDLKTRYVENLQINVGVTLGINETVHTESDELE